MPPPIRVRLGYLYTAGTASSVSWRVTHTHTHMECGSGWCGGRRAGGGTGTDGPSTVCPCHVLHAQAHVSCCERVSAHEFAWGDGHGCWCVVCCVLWRMCVCLLPVLLVLLTCCVVCLLVVSSVCSNILVYIRIFLNATSDMYESS